MAYHTEKSVHALETSRNAAGFKFVTVVHETLLVCMKKPPDGVKYVLYPSDRQNALRQLLAPEPERPVSFVIRSFP